MSKIIHPAYFHFYFQKFNIKMIKWRGRAIDTQRKGENNGGVIFLLQELQTVNIF